MAGMTETCQCPPEAGAATCEVRVLPVERVVCPTNGKAGKVVDTRTVKALLSLPLTEVRSPPYYFCKEADCPTVYYSADGQTFTEAHLRERVYQKHPNDDEVHVCYCFRHTPASIQDEWTKTGDTTVVASITAGIQAGQCACDIRNPQGSCCLGNVNNLVRQISLPQ